MSVLGLMVIVLGLFLMADRLGNSSPSDDSSTPDSDVAASPSPVASGSPTAINTDKLRTARDVAEVFVNLWSAERYEEMYDLLSATSQTLISREDFVDRYRGIAQEVGQSSIKATIAASDPNAQQIPMHVVRESGRVGTIEEDNTIPLLQDGESWRINWTPSLIFKDLNDGFIRWRPDIPQRGRILDRKGRPLAHLGTISKVGVVPGQIQDEPALLKQLAELLQLPEDTIKSRYQGGQPDWFMPIRSFPDQMDAELLRQLAAIPGVAVQKWPERVYPAGPAAAHIVGYLSEVTAEELPELAKQGYIAGDRVGRAGIEAWGEQYLSGKRGGKLLIVGPDGAARKTITEVKSEPAADIVLTIDLDVQLAAQQALAEQTGAVVVIDPNNGAILALASNPTFDPNQFILGHTEETWAQLNDPERRPLENRATHVGYATGSTFKVVTMTAGMESLGLTPQSRVECPATFSLPGADQVWRDWTPNGQGTLTLHNALVQSCNTVFYKIGAELDTKDQNILPNTAEGFGFGSPTGLQELPEVSGVVPDPEWKLKTVGDYWARGDAVNLAIGQGFFLATPLQVADAYAAIANGGTLWQPYIVQEAVKLDGSKAYVAEPKERGKLPLSAEHLNAIRAALKDVVSAGNGTALPAFAGEQQPVAGKTGTAENAQGPPHAWFASFSPIDAPKLTAVALVEHGNAGSSVSAPMVRQVIDAYYAANP